MNDSTLLKTNSNNSLGQMALNKTKKKISKSHKLNLKMRRKKMKQTLKGRCMHIGNLFANVPVWSIFISTGASVV